MTDDGGSSVFRCSWCRRDLDLERRWDSPAYCSGRCRTAAYRARRRTTPRAFAADLVAEAERVEVLAGRARTIKNGDAPFVGAMLERLAVKLRDAAAQIDPAELFPTGESSPTTPST